MILLEKNCKHLLLVALLIGAASTAACTSSAVIVTGNSMLKRILPLKLMG